MRSARLAAGLARLRPKYADFLGKKLANAACMATTVADAESRQDALDAKPSLPEASRHSYAAWSVNCPHASVISFCVATSVAAGTWSFDARCDGASIDGPWKMTAVTETFAVQDWSEPCGPRPVSGTLLPGGPVTLTSMAGEIAVAGPSRVLRTNACLDALPTLSPWSHSRDGRSWRTRCVTPASDPRHAVMNTAFFLAPGDDTISMAETGRYAFMIDGARCVADVTRSGSMSRALATSPSAAPPVTALPPPEPAAKTPALPAHTCDVVGLPARLEVSPSRKLLRAGETFAFRAAVVDAHGCPTATPIAWAIGPIEFADGQPRPARALIDESGRVTLAVADFGDATFDVLATAAGRTARASVRVASAADYQALLAESGLDPNGESGEASVTDMATSTIGASGARIAEGVRRREWFIAAISAFAVALGVVAFIGARRARRASNLERAAAERHRVRVAEYERQKRALEEQHAAQLRAHRESVAIAQQQAYAAAARGLTAPDTAPASSQTAGRGKVCPICGTRFEAAATFCGKDGSQLVPLN
ncbi:MAG: bZIP transcription factor [Polyangiaceae bacterium]